jgi:hypothetical protein
MRGGRGARHAGVHATLAQELTLSIKAPAAAASALHRKSHYEVEIKR